MTREPRTRHDGDCGIYDAFFHVCTCGFFHECITTEHPDSEDERLDLEYQSRRVLDEFWHSGRKAPLSAAEKLGAEQCDEMLRQAFGNTREPPAP